ncbi:hypothetical protein C5167_008183 [Papaver somniferum]|uniref:UDP-glycosyltransferases domain-containing protein n=1 Tax=Papaver somniferum TaxID=3469 RepID=A0A4Y7JUV3_PAPSO|nr:hypothetical protein C5167_008183 [Papaver somniferum]
MIFLKPHVVCAPFPTQGQINPMLKLAKLLHHKGFYVTFVNTEHNHQSLLNSRGPDSLRISLPYAIPPAKLCIIAGGWMSFTLDAAEELDIPEILSWTPSGCGFMAFMHYKDLIENGLTPLKEESQLPNGYLDNTKVDWIPGMKDICLADFPIFIRTTDPNDIILTFITSETQRSKRASSIVVNTFDAMEGDVLNGMKSIFPFVYSVGPLSSLLSSLVPRESEVHSLRSNLLTHSGWNSTLDTVIGGVPILSWPFFDKQHINCKYCCVDWGIGMEIDKNVKRNDVEKLVRELMDGENGKKLKKRVMEWKLSAEDAISAPNGSSFVNLDKLVNQTLNF